MAASNPGITCPNCNEHRVGPFCARCGQNHRDFRRALPPLVTDLLKEAFELDGRLMASLRLLLMRPGQLTAEFSRNRRAAYVSPVRLFLFASLLFFFVLSVSTDVSVGPQGSTSDPDIEVLADDDVAYFKSQLRPAEHAYVDTALQRGSVGGSIIRGLVRSAAESRDANEEMSAFGRFLVGRAVAALAAPQAFINQLLDNLPIGLFVLLPVYAVLLKLIYIRRRKYYVEHLVFALHVHTFAFIVFTLVALLPESADATPMQLETSSEHGVRRVDTTDTPDTADTTDTTDNPAAVIEAAGDAVNSAADDDAQTLANAAAATGEEDAQDSIWDTAANLLYLGLLIYYLLALKRYYQQGVIKTLFKFGVLLTAYSALLLPSMLVAAFATIALF